MFGISTRQWHQRQQENSNMLVLDQQNLGNELAAQSPDLNPTENLWGEIKTTVSEEKLVNVNWLAQWMEHSSGLDSFCFTGWDLKLLTLDVLLS